MLNPGSRGKKLLVLVVAVTMLSAGAWLIAGCYPAEIESVQELDLVVSLFDKSANFGALKTYSMPDSIVHICAIEAEQQERDCPKELTRAYDAKILSQIRQNLLAMGFTPATDPQQADVFVVVAANATDNYGGYTYYPWYWGWYYPGYPGWGWYYPPTTVVYEFTTGALLINMIDPAKKDTANKRVGTVWVAAINGLLGEGGNPQTRLTTTIDQAFQQSTYLGAGK